MFYSIQEITMIMLHLSFSLTQFHIVFAFIRNEKTSGGPSVAWTKRPGVAEQNRRHSIGEGELENDEKHYLELPKNIIFLIQTECFFRKSQCCTCDIRTALPQFDTVFAFVRNKKTSVMQ